MHRFNSYPIIIATFLVVSVLVVPLAMPSRTLASGLPSINMATIIGVIVSVVVTLAIGIPPEASFLEGLFSPASIIGRIAGTIASTDYRSCSFNVVWQSGCPNNNPSGGAGSGVSSQPPPSDGAVCYSPTNSCNQAYKGTWSCPNTDTNQGTDYLYEKSNVGTRLINTANAQRFDPASGCTCSSPDYAPPASGCPTLSCSFSPSPSTISSGQSSALSWSCSGATSCSIDNGVGSVNPSSGSKNVSPSQTTTYNLSCSGSAGSKSYPATLTVNQPPLCTFSASPSRIIPPQSSSLLWSCQNANSCSLDNGIGAVSVSGSKNVSPSQTTTYSLSCSGIGGASSFKSTVTVTDFNIREVGPVN